MFDDTLLKRLRVGHPMPDVIMLHLMGKDEPRERILGEEVKKN